MVRKAGAPIYSFRLQYQLSHIFENVLEDVGLHVVKTEFKFFRDGTFSESSENCVAYQLFLMTVFKNLLERKYPSETIEMNGDCFIIDLKFPANQSVPN